MGVKIKWKNTMHMPLITCFSYIIIRNSTFLVIVLNSYPILELIGTDMKHKIINLKKSGILIMAVFAMVTTLCARPLMAFADGDDTYWPEGPQINSPCAVVMEVNTGTVLYEKNSHEKHYPASITKILTTYLTILNCKMDEKVTFSKEAVKESSDGSSSIKRDVGEEMTMEQTLYGVMLESANECAYAAAEHTGKKLGGDYSTFIDLMNKEAEELGCTDTHFNNANGLPDENHWTSAYDMGLISCAAYRNDEFRKITGTKTYIIPPTNKHTEDTPLYNHHAMLHPFKSYSQFVNQDCTGGKTGYTSVANSTLVTYAEKDGLTLCTVIMNAQSPDQYADTNTLLNYCFSNFKALSIAENENSAATDNTPDLGVMNEHGMYAKVSENYVVLPNNADFSSVKREAADMKSDNKDALATVRYKYCDHVVGCVDLLKSGAKVDLSYFDENSRQNLESDIIRIKPVYFLWVLVLIAVIILSIFMFRRISDNIYVLKHKWSIKKEQRERFREHKLERKQRRRRDNLKFSGRHKY